MIHTLRIPECSQDVNTAQANCHIPGNPYILPPTDIMTKLLNPELLKDIHTLSTLGKPCDLECFGLRVN